MKKNSDKCKEKIAEVFSLCNKVYEKGIPISFIFNADTGCVSIHHNEYGINLRNKGTYFNDKDFESNLDDFINYINGLIKEQDE